MKSNPEISTALFNLMNELHDKQQKFDEQIQQDMNYIMSARHGNSHDGKGVTPELKLKVDSLFSIKT